jgi:hypothetical protein
MLRAGGVHHVRRAQRKPGGSPRVQELQVVGDQTEPGDGRDVDPVGRFLELRLLREDDEVLDAVGSRTENDIPTTSARAAVDDEPVGDLRIDGVHVRHGDVDRELGFLVTDVERPVHSRWQLDERLLDR